MGVPRLFPWLIATFPTAIRHFVEGSFRRKVGYLYLDANGLLHGAAQQVYNYGGGKSLLNIYGRLNDSEKLQKTFELFFQNIFAVTQIIVPTKVLYIAIDGPAPLAKQAQQRQRRFVAAKLRAESAAAAAASSSSTSSSSSANSTPFNSSSITPGTMFMHKLHQYLNYKIREVMNDQTRSWKSIEVIFSPPTVAGEGEHKCFSAGTEVWLWNGATKVIEDITEGDVVIGDDGTARKVISQVSGESKMYKVSQMHGNDYCVNGSHILTLKIADHKRIYWATKPNAWIIGWLDSTTLKYRKKQFSVSKFKTKENARVEANDFLATLDSSDMLEIQVKDYLNLPKNTRAKLYGYKCSIIRWEKKHVHLDPYLLGLWLGDGSKEGYQFTTGDPEVLEYWKNWAKDNDGQIVSGREYVYTLSNINGRKAHYNPFRRLLQRYNLVRNKHIPIDYLVNDEETRLQLLAGLIDTDGNLTKGGRLIRFSQGPCNFGLFDGVVKLAQSLGFKCTTNDIETHYTYKGERRDSTAKQLHISGDIERIPTRIPRKRCIPKGNGPKSINIDWRRTKIDIAPIEDGKYYGIGVDGNHRFLLADTTVVHNCLDYMRALPRRIRETESHCIFGPDGDLIMLALSAHIPNMFLFREDQYTPDFYHFIDMGLVRRELAGALGQTPGVRARKRTLDDVTNDFIVEGFFVGNDFLPKIQMFHLLEEGIQLMFNTYAKTSGGGNNNFLTVGGKFDLEGFRHFVRDLSRHEETFLIDQATTTNPKKVPPEPRFRNETLIQTISGSRGKYTIDLQAYRKAYYAKFNFPGEPGSQEFERELERVCHDYLKSFIWVYEYYVTTLPDWRWAYEHHYAPLMVDFYRYITRLSKEEFVEICNFTLKGPSLPFEQLLSVLPAASAELLPRQLQRLMLMENSPLVKSGYYPKDFPIDYEGKLKEYQGVTILPFVDYDEIHRNYERMVKCCITNPEKYVRNTPGKVQHFKYTPRYLAKYTSRYGTITRSKIKKIEK